MSRTRLLVVAIFLVFSTSAYAEEASELNTFLMNSTFKISGQGSSGTVFFIGKPVKDDPTRLYYVMVTAAHVLEGIAGEDATLLLRNKHNDGTYSKLPYKMKIRSKSKPLWAKHPEVDVAVMYAKLPKEAEVRMLPCDLLATDEILEKNHIHPGDVMSCLGFPFGAEANDEGFPILRSGHIASYPITPTRKLKTFLFGINVFEGNSGGPVYFVQSGRAFGNTIQIGTTQFLAGLVSQQKFVNEEVRSLRETRTERHQLGLAIVIHASLIKETVEMLPPAPVE